MKNTRIIALFLMSALLVSCGGTGTSSDTASDDTTSTQIETSDSNYISDLPDSYDFGDFKLRVLKQDPKNIQWTLNTFAPEEENADPLNDVMYRRSRSVEDKYGFMIEEYLSEWDPTDEVQKTVLADEDMYDIALCQINNSKKLLDGLVTDLNEVPNLNLSKHYWNQDLTEQLSIKGKIFFATGDIIVSYDDSMMIMTYNRSLGEDFGIESLYDTVRAGNWTYDKLMECVRIVSQDLDSNGIQDEKDRYGLMYAVDAAAAPYLGCSGVGLYEIGSDGMLTFIGDSERMHDAWEKYNSLISDKTLSYDWGDLPSENRAGRVAAMLGEKQVLFQSMVLSMVRRNYRDIELDFGILPLPKLDEAQENYITIINLATPYIFVPRSVRELDKVGFALEALAAASGEVTRNYYEVCMESKYTRDEASFEMIELASENIVFDAGFVFSWGGFGAELTRSIKIADSPYASKLAEYKTKTESEMGDFITKLFE